MPISVVAPWSACTIAPLRCSLLPPLLVAFLRFRFLLFRDGRRVVLVTLLGSLDYFEGNASHAGEYFALLCFGAVGMMLMASSVELLMVFVGLEISSISTYILCGFRKGQATGSESSTRTVYASLVREATAGRIPRATLVASWNRILLLKSGM